MYPLFSLFSLCFFFSFYFSLLVYKQIAFHIKEKIWNSNLMSNKKSTRSSKSQYYIHIDRLAHPPKRNHLINLSLESHVKTEQDWGVCIDISSCMPSLGLDKIEKKNK